MTRIEQTIFLTMYSSTANDTLEVYDGDVHLNTRERVRTVVGRKDQRGEEGTDAWTKRSMVTEPSPQES